MLEAVRSRMVEDEVHDLAWPTSRLDDVVIGLCRSVSRYGLYKAVDMLQLVSMEQSLLRDSCCGHWKSRGIGS